MSKFWGKVEKIVSRRAEGQSYLHSFLQASTAPWDGLLETSDAHPWDTDRLQGSEELLLRYYQDIIIDKMLSRDNMVISYMITLFPYTSRLQS